MSAADSPLAEAAYVHVTAPGEPCAPGFAPYPLAVDAPEPQLPFASQSVSGLYMTRLLERLDEAAAARLLRECRRVLRPGGWFRVVTEDLGSLFELYASPAAWAAANFDENGYDWHWNRADVVNRRLREARHMYDIGAIERLASLAGFVRVERCAAGVPRAGAEASAPFTGLEDERDSRLIVEMQRPAPPAEDEQPLVSVLIPLYRTTYFAEALRSALDQTYDRFEVVIGDDGDEDAARAVLAGFARHPRADRIRYQHNPERLGDAGNFAACLARARGSYIKFLSDDDRLEPACLERMAACLRSHPEVTLVTSHRRSIDEHGRPLPDVATTRPLVSCDSVISGPSLIAEILRTRLNTIGEPSTVMFRKRDVASGRPNFWFIGGCNTLGNGDVSVWVSLLAQGDAIYLTEPLSAFRQHATQMGGNPQVQRLARIAWLRLADLAARFGLYDPEEPAPLSARPLWPLPWWPDELQQLVGAAQGSAPLLAALASYPDDVALRAHAARMLVEEGHPEHAMQLLAPAVRAGVRYRPLYTTAALAIAAQGQPDAANEALANTHTMMPLWRLDRGVVRGYDGAHYLTHDAHLTVEAGLPALRLRVKLRCRETGGFRRQPLRLTASVDGHVQVRARIERDDATCELSVVLPPRPTPASVRLQWEGEPHHDLPADAVPLAIEVLGIALELEPGR